MPFQPALDLARLTPLLDDLGRLRQELDALDIPPTLQRWLQVQTEARGAHMSTRIEGNLMTEPEVRNLFARPQGEGAGTRAELENLDYRDAARFARQAGGDFHADIDGGLIRALHFLTVRTTDHTTTAGQYRTRQNVVLDGQRGRAYLPPPPGDVPKLMTDLVLWARHQRGKTHPLVIAAVMHAEFVKIHPFDDGNGRTARALTVYFFERGGWLLSRLVSIEQVFAEPMSEYYANLNALGDRYPLTPPDLTGWCEWFFDRLEKHVGRAVAVVETHSEATERFEQVLLDRNLPARLAWAVRAMYFFGEVTAKDYEHAAGIARATAVHDLNELMARTRVERVGSGPTTKYRVPGNKGLSLQDFSID
ncbi:MAG: Fic family protein [Chloroflexi bacterium]|nr:Fic family protein [Chloroflexota bacterium]